MDLRQNLRAFVKRGVYKWSHLAARLFNRTATTFHPIQMDDLSLRDSITVTAITRRLFLPDDSVVRNATSMFRYIPPDMFLWMGYTNHRFYEPINELIVLPENSNQFCLIVESILYSRYSSRFGKMIFDIYIFFFFFSCSQEIYKRLSVGWKH